MSTRPASESDHWYARDGTPCHEVPYADRKRAGELRPTTLRDARGLDLVPSVTSVLRVLAKPGLEVWKQRQTLEAALTLPRREGESDASYIPRVMEDAAALARDAASEGKRIHGAIERAYRGLPFDAAYERHVEAAQAVVRARVGDAGWAAERSFAHSLGYGGCIDLHCTGWVIDFKGKDFDESNAADLRLYDEHAMQLAAYREGVAMPSARGLIVFVSRTVPGLAVSREVEPAALERGWEMFQACLALWKLVKRYDGRLSA